MEQKTTNLFFALLRSAVSGRSLTIEEKIEYSEALIEDLFSVALKHDMGHLLAFGMKQNGLLPKNDEMGIGNFIFNAVMRVEKIKYEFGTLCDVLEKAGIAFLPLKGSVIRDFYPEDWMRTSCDIDVLVHKEDEEKATNILVNECGYTYHWKNSHNVSLFTQNNVHVELHYELIEEGLANEASKVLDDVWDCVKLKDGCSYHYEMPDEMFYFYHIAHMAKHFENGGCGIRPFVDTWELDNINGIDVEKRNKVLEQGKLLKFAEAARRLSRVWFDNQERDAISQQIEDYILRGGQYGNDENRIAVKQQKSGGKFKYAMSKIFLPYDELQYHYAILQKHRWLMPAMQVRRWGKLIFCGHLKRTTEELRYSGNISQEEANEVRNFLNNVGL